MNTNQFKEVDERFDEFLLGSFENGLHVPRTKEEWYAFLHTELLKEKEKSFKAGLERAVEYVRKNAGLVYTEELKTVLEEAKSLPVKK